ncbi:hypothetical protein B0H10DRAFT_1797371 [Mycena sp. CBHHK59/15]|nr:hypothetical protein B0H10DRAFT_1797371 [Mycena sp. CBHHK59/15]
MGRWTQYDEDDYQLPEGMKRIGYDADTRRYYFRDQDGSVWQGAEGAEFSEMTRGAFHLTWLQDSLDDEDIEAAPRRADGYQVLATDSNASYNKYSPNNNPYRTLFPFFLLIGVVLLLIWRLILSPGLSAPASPCPTDATSYLVEPGDTCWEISQTRGCSLDEFKKLNPKVECGSLMPGTTVCLPNAAASIPA